jgi:hypothetical protein
MTSDDDREFDKSPSIPMSKEEVNKIVDGIISLNHEHGFLIWVDDVDNAIYWDNVAALANLIRRGSAYLEHGNSWDEAALKTKLNEAERAYFSLTGS